MTALRILVTGAGAPGIKGTLYALRNNPDRRPVYIIGIDMKDTAVGKYLVDSFHQVPSPQAADYVERLQTICREERLDVLIPQTTKETEFFAAHQHDFGSTKVLVSDAAAIAVANNKYELLKRFEQLGLPYPEYVLAKTREELIQAVQHFGYPEQPVVVKPPVSNGMRGFRILRENCWDTRRFLAEKPSGVEISLDSLLAIFGDAAEIPPLLVTEYLPGPEYSVDAFIGKTTEIAVPRLRQSIRSGISFENAIEFRRDMMDYTLEAGKNIGMHYMFGFQFKLDEAGVPKLLECNPRIQGTMVASLFAGVNIIWLGVKERLGEEIAPVPVEKLQEVAFSRFWGGLGIMAHGVEEI